MRSQDSDKRVASSPSQAPGFPFPSFRCCRAAGGMNSKVVSNMPSGQKSAHMICHMSSNMVCSMRWNMRIGRHGYAAAGHRQRGLIANCDVGSFCSSLCRATRRTLPITALQPKTFKKKEETRAVFLPHELFANLAKDNLGAFWPRAEGAGDERPVPHPVKGHQWKKYAIPNAFIHTWGWNGIRKHI